MKLLIVIASLVVAAAALFAPWPTGHSETAVGDPNTSTSPPGVGARGEPEPNATVPAELSELPIGEEARGPVVQPASGAWPSIRTGQQRSYPGPAPAGAIVFPDGTWFPPINGVADPLPHPGFKRQPWSPVVAVMRDSIGQLWFQHANGANSSVELVDVTERGVKKKMAIWKVGTPVEPVAPELGGAGRALPSGPGETQKR